MFARFGCGLGIENVANPSENAIMQAKTMYFTRSFHRFSLDLQAPEGRNPRVLRVPAPDNEQNSRIQPLAPKSFKSVKLDPRGVKLTKKYNIETSKFNWTPAV